MTPIKKLRLPAIDALKALAIIGVILIHLPATGRFECNAWNSIQTGQSIFEWCVLAFFLVSGMTAFQGSDFTKSFLVEFIKKRVKRLLIPYFCFSWFYKSIMIGLSYGGQIGTAKYDIPASVEQWLDFVLMPATPQMYFLLILFGVQLLGLGFNWLCRKWLAFLISMLFVFPFLFFSELHLSQPLHGFRANLVPFYFGSYAFGYFTTMVTSKSMFRFTSFLTVVILCLALLLNWGIKPINLMIPLWIYFAFSHRRSEVVLHPLAWLGRKSGMVYVWHAPVVISGATLGIIKFAGGGILSVGLIIIVTIILSLCIGTIVNRISWLKPFHF